MFNEMPRRDSIENRGTFLEHEFFNTIDKTNYGLVAKELLSPQTKPLRTTEDVERAMMAKYDEKSKYLQTLNSDSYIKYADAMKLVEKCQPGDPSKPKTLFASSLINNISNKLAEGFQVKFFTVVGSHLDTKHGVDAFIKLYNQEGKEIACATIDISQHEKSQPKANLVMIVSNKDRDVFDQQSELFDREEFEKRIDSEANRVIETLSDDLKNRKNKKRF
ncbi:hypothetical protein CVU83_03565 [Candidatus Falkowbacteria bacterium HGW-Falkowbacteria-2]|uniref:Uncharacterized protein n=1 Tax=Candidatus Falkowbacteria bacterium HGW-Falkowbacteria-2 TaxID=2013769 RepID=A0A2N2DWY0_9BACT|nr:MAG: hypothetical protein CVU83_03565 [Candidatus Falkowbacteria bacterium HGW-Falkowbacteria-2]